MKKTPASIAWIIFAAAAVVVLCVCAIALTRGGLEDRQLLLRPDGQQLLGIHYVSESDVISVSDGDITSSADAPAADVSDSDKGAN